MGIPVDDIDAALTVATSHGSRLVDVGRLTLLDDETTDHGHAFLIIAGIGFDALIAGATVLVELRFDEFDLGEMLRLAELLDMLLALFRLGL